MSRSVIAGHGAMRGPGGAEPVDVLLTVPEVAAQLRVCERTVRRLLASGALPCLRIGRSVRISASDLATLLRPDEKR